LVNAKNDQEFLQEVELNIIGGRGVRGVNFSEHGLEEN
jgi:hypothetical protein